MGPLLLAAGGLGSSTPAQAGGGVRFVDERPVAIDLSRLPTPPRWQVEVFNGETAGPAKVNLAASSSPPGDLSIEPAVPVEVPPGGRATFDLLLTGARPGSGQLTAFSTDGTLATRSVEIEAGGSPVPLPDEVTFSALHVAPWSSPVHVRYVRLFGVTSSSGPTTVGIVTSGAGRSARVVLRGDQLVVDGLHASGDYRGIAELPGQRSVKVHVQVHDAPGYPLLVLLAGLLVVGLLDRHNKRTRPRQVLEIHLARLQQTARLQQAAEAERLLSISAPARPSGVPRISDESGATKLLLDRQVEEALRSWDGAVDDAVQKWWAEDGAGLDDLDKLVRKAEGLGTRFQQLFEEIELLLPIFPDGLLPKESQLAPAVARATGHLDLTSAEDLDRQSDLVAEASAGVQRFRDLFQRIKYIETNTADKALEQRAKTLLSRLCRGTGYPEIEAETVVLERAALAAVDKRPDHDFGQLPRPTLSAGTQGATPGAGDRGTSSTAGARSRDQPPKAPARRRRGVYALSAVAGLVLVLAAGMFASNAGTTDEGAARVQGPETTVPSTAPSIPTVHPVSPTTLDASAGGGGPAPGGGSKAGGPPAPVVGGGPPPTVVHPPTTPTLLNAPVAEPLRGEPAPEEESRGPSLVDVGTQGVAWPVGTAALLGALIWPAVLRSRRRRRQGTGLSRGPDTLTSVLRKDQRRFDVLSALIVVLTGLSVLYFSDPTFGSLGDYTKLMLWGSGVGEGVQVARRIIPALPT